MTTSTLARTQFPSAVLVAVGLAAGFGVARAPASARWAGLSAVAGVR